ncbi:nicotinate-nucleotide adenylyltransferase [Niveispirillum sp. KHB5.9]|uniref:nicotinate-nucleotide adenylyltransferase n=1 Tax=Niveispirillum sp. KHB5.9 TaxID=3400269 RepID=UPI003A84F401
MGIRGPDRPPALPAAHDGRCPTPPKPGAGTLWRGLRVGLLGGSFNPAHAGHRHMSEMALRALNLDQVWWLVSPQNPLKPLDGMGKLADRLAGARAVANHPRIVVSDIETRLRTRYTVDTLTALKGRFPATKFVWLMGADNLVQVPRWRDWTRIFDSVPVAIFPRHPYSTFALGGKASRRFAIARVDTRQAGGLADLKPPAWIFLDVPLHPASATAIRQGLGATGP